MNIVSNIVNSNTPLCCPHSLPFRIPNFPFAYALAQPNLYTTPAQPPRESGKGRRTDANIIVEEERERECNRILIITEKFSKKQKTPIPIRAHLAAKVSSWGMCMQLM